MPPIDTEKLLQPIAADAPAGVHIEYGAEVDELDRSARGKPEQQIGSAVVPGEPPDWRAVEKQALSLLSKSKDLRFAAHLLNALLHMQGFEGLSDGLALTRGMLERYWPDIYPRL